jgi:hypothetical protein
MDVLIIAFNALVSPTTWIPGIGAGVLLARLPWFWRASLAAGVTFIVGLGFALFLTPGDPGNWPRVVGATIAGGLWTVVAMFVVFGTQPGTRE